MTSDASTVFHGTTYSPSSYTLSFSRESAHSLASPYRTLTHFNVSFNKIILAQRELCASMPAG